MMNYFFSIFLCGCDCIKFEMKIEKGLPRAYSILASQTNQNFNEERLMHSHFFFFYTTVWKKEWWCASTSVSFYGEAGTSVKPVSFLQDFLFLNMFFLHLLLWNSTFTNKILEMNSVPASTLVPARNSCASSSIMKKKRISQRTKTHSSKNRKSQDIK